MRSLGVIGNVNVDIIMGPVAPWPRPGTEIVVAHEEVRPGGAAGNAALAWQALGVPFQAAASTGHDLFGAFLRDAFGAIAAGWTVVDAPTTLSVGVTHPDGERTFLTTRGHIEHFTAEEALRQFDARLDGGILLLCGVFLMPRVTDDYGAIFDWAAARGIDVALDTGWPPDGWTDATVAAARDWAARSRHLLVNAVEAAALTGESDMSASARSLLAMMRTRDPVAVIKLGAKGALACSGAGRIDRVPARDVAIVDTIGAGDAFNAGYLAAVASGEAVTAALAAGIDSATMAITRVPEEASPSERPRA
jgi:sugar/nucleoside kinase (ribokinase family)